MTTALITLAFIVVGLFINKVEHYLTTISEAVVSMQGDVEAVRSEVGTIAAEVATIKRAVTAPLLLLLLCVAGCAGPTSPDTSTSLSANVSPSTPDAYVWITGSHVTAEWNSDAMITLEIVAVTAQQIGVLDLSTLNPPPAFDPPVATQTGRAPLEASWSRDQTHGYLAHVHLVSGSVTHVTLH